MRRKHEAVRCYDHALELCLELLAKDPQAPAVRYERAALLNNYSTLLARQIGRGASALQKYQESARLLDRLVGDFPYFALYRRDLANTYHQMAMLLTISTKPESALDYFQRALKQREVLVQRFPEVRYYQADHCQSLGEVHVRHGRHAEAARAAEDLAQAATQRWQDAYNASGLLARCARLAEKDDALTGERRQELARSYADRALDCLREATRRGFGDAEQLRKDGYLESLRSTSSEDFQQLLRELEGKTQAGKQ